jgi:surfactin synthase thioesterase subunit
MSEIVSNVADSLEPFITENNCPYCFYGHSLGSLVAFEVTRELQRRKLPLPRHLYFSGRGGPNAPEPVKNQISAEVGHYCFVILYFTL